VKSIAICGDDDEAHPDDDDDDDADDSDGEGNPAGVRGLALRAKPNPFIALPDFWSWRPNSDTASADSW
jgi:hypothetical protein